VKTRWLGLGAAAYLFGAFPTGALVARAYGVDLTQRGSRRTGATNALRVLGKPAAVGILVVDALKGVLAVRLARRYGQSDWAPPAAALLAMGGHTYSVFLGGKGGRGVATGLGALLALSPGALLVAAGAGAGTIAASRLVSLGSLVGALAGAGALAAQVARGRAPRSYTLFSLGGAAFLVNSHRDNVARLLAGTERRLGQPADAEPEVVSR
jgi:acyl phosphate:glycerol-3-phosphate acyltransferase